jgi:hypothetical protein
MNEWTPEQAFNSHDWSDPTEALRDAHGGE